MREHYQETNEYKEGYPMTSALILRAGYERTELEKFGLDDLQKKRWDLICWQEACRDIGSLYALDDKIAEIDQLIEKLRGQDAA